MESKARSQGTLKAEFPMRLQVYMAKCGVGSRRACEELISQGRVMINNRQVREMGTKVNADDVVQVDMETIELEDKLYYIALNKPRGYVCTNYDPNETKYARDLIDIKDNSLLFNVGRLDKDSTGLIIFTNDGDFANKMMHPRYQVEKEYIVKLDRAVEIEDLQRAIHGVYIDMPKPYKILRYDLMPQTRQYIRVTLIEGKNREIRKIFSYLGYEVKSLTRIRVGTVELDDLTPGEYRNLTREEIAGLLSGKGSSQAKSKKTVTIRGKEDGNRD